MMLHLFMQQLACFQLTHIPLYPASPLFCLSTTLQTPMLRASVLIEGVAADDGDADGSSHQNDFIVANEADADRVSVLVFQSCCPHMMESSSHLTHVSFVCVCIKNPNSHFLRLKRMTYLSICVEFNLPIV